MERKPLSTATCWGILPQGEGFSRSLRQSQAKWLSGNPVTGLILWEEVLVSKPGLRNTLTSLCDGPAAPSQVPSLTLPKSRVASEQTQT